MVMMLSIGWQLVIEWLEFYDDMVIYGCEVGMELFIFFGYIYLFVFFLDEKWMVLDESRGE